MEDIETELSAAVKRIVDRREGILLAGINTAEALVKRRVFDEGRASDGLPIGTYAKATEERKRKAGTLGLRTGSTVNLADKRDLFTSIRTASRSEDNVVLGITNREDSAKARSNEVRYRRQVDTIFALNEEEGQAVQKTMINYIKRILNDI